MALEMGPVFRKAKGEEITAVMNLDGGATITLRFQDPEDMRTLRRKSNALAWDNEKKQFDSFEDKKQFDILLADAAILDFTGMVVEGVEIPYSKENARTLMLHSLVFGTIVQSRVFNFQYFIKEKKEAVRKEHEKK